MRFVCTNYISRNTKLRMTLFVCGIILLATPLAAQQLTVSASTAMPAASGIQGGTVFTKELSALTLSATGGSVLLDGITFTVGGSGDFANDLDPSTGISIWQDDGDGSFNSTLDTNLGTTGGASPTITVNFTSTLTVPNATSIDIWIVGDFLASAGASIAETFQVSVANTGDVNVQTPSTVLLVAPAPTSNTLSVVVFFVSSFSPTSSYKKRGFIIYGSGFTPPVSASIGGIDLGVADNVNATHTWASGLNWVIPDFGPVDGDYDVVITTGLLGPITLTPQFHYVEGEYGGSTGPLQCSAVSARGNYSYVLFAILCSLAAAMRYFQRGKRISEPSSEAV